MSDMTSKSLSDLQTWEEADKSQATLWQTYFGFRDKKETIFQHSEKTPSTGSPYSENSRHKICPAYKKCRDKDREDMEGMANQWLPQTETHLMGKNQPLTLLITPC